MQVARLHGLHPHDHDVATVDRLGRHHAGVWHDGGGDGVSGVCQRVLLIDDLITTGLTLKKAAEAIKAEGGVVNEAVVLLDREEGGKEKSEKRGIRLHALLKVSEVANHLYEIGAIDQEQLRTILKQIKKG